MGFHIYCGSQNLNPLALVEAERKAYELALGLRHELALDLEFVNLGGGFGIPYFDTESELDLGPISQGSPGSARARARSFPAPGW